LDLTPLGSKLLELIVMLNPSLSLIGIPGVPLIKPGDKLAEIILVACQKQEIVLQDNDILVITQKIISKAEGRFRNLDTTKVGLKARLISLVTHKDPRFVQLVLEESTQVLRVKENTLIVEHKNGFVCANAGIDHSNVDENNQENLFLLLPVNPDLSAQLIRAEIEQKLKIKIGVLIIDSHGRAWRNGTIGMAIGFSGLPGLVDLRGKEDLFGFKLRITMVATADELAAGASLLMGQAKEGVPVVIARGFPYELREGMLSELIRAKKDDLFR
jgi:coenzyme F420-0:L-glutamate ligase / coenzyme F420-1:gamma-L-glutamate ligase